MNDKKMISEGLLNTAKKIEILAVKSNIGLVVTGLLGGFCMVPFIIINLVIGLLNLITRKDNGEYILDVLRDVKMAVWMPISAIVAVFDPAKVAAIHMSFISKKHKFFVGTPLLLFGEPFSEEKYEQYINKQRNAV